MLRLIIDAQEFYDEENNRFIKVEPCVVELEHSLISLSKWEETWETPFLHAKELSYEQELDYIRCMTVNDIPDNVYYAITPSQRTEILKYLSKKMTATVITKDKTAPKGRSSELITAETIYWWMASLQIPFDPCERWNLNRLLALIELGSIKSQPPKKMGRGATARMNTQINEARRKALGTHG